MAEGNKKVIHKQTVWTEGTGSPVLPLPSGTAKGAELHSHCSILLTIKEVIRNRTASLPAHQVLTFKVIDSAQE